MKYLRQFVIILGVSFLGEILRVILPLPVPASVYGLICMLLLLKSGIIPVAIIITVTTVFVMAVTGKVTQAMMNRKKKGEQYAGDYK